jgi:hypothetical protein
MLTAAALITAALLAQGIILGLWSTGFAILAFGTNLSQIVGMTLFWSLLVQLLHYAAFGLGVYASIRYVAPLSAGESWRQVIVRGVIATVVGALAALAFGAIVSLIAAVTIGPYPFGQSLNTQFDPLTYQYGLENMLAGALTPLIQWLPVTVLGCVFLRLWLAAHPWAIEATDRASVSA